MRVGTRRIDAGPAGGFDLVTAATDVPGPTVVVLGGVHGDETEGALAAGRLAHHPPGLEKGRLLVIPVCHEAAFAADSRVSPLDGGNLARVFPGDPDGSPTRALAHHIYREALVEADLLIDLHTSGQAYDMPFLAGYGGDRPDSGSWGERAARAFGADFVWRHPGRSEGRTVSMVEQAIYCESPGGGPTDPGRVDAYCEGVLRVLGEFGLVSDPPPPPARPPIRVTGGGNLDRDMASVSHDGVFLAAIARGDRVVAGQSLGRVIDLGGETLEELHASVDGFVMALKRRSPVRAGDLVVNVAAPDS